MIQSEIMRHTYLTIHIIVLNGAYLFMQYTIQIVKRMEVHFNYQYSGRLSKH